MAKADAELKQILRRVVRSACGAMSLLLAVVLVLTISVKLEAKALKDVLYDLPYDLYHLDPALSRRMEVAQAEFAKVADDIADELIRVEVALRIDRDETTESGQLWRARKATWGQIFALPRALYLGSVRRAAINLVQERVIIFDLELWENEKNPQAKRLLVLTELGRFAGIEAEDDRYRWAARTLNLIDETPQFNQMADAFDVDLSRQGDFTVIDKEKTFLSFNFEGLDETRVYLMNPYSEAIHGRLCQAPGQPKPDPFTSKDVVRRLYEGMASFPDTVAICQEAIVKRRPMTARLVFSALNLHLTVCSPKSFGR